MHSDAEEESCYEFTKDDDSEDLPIVLDPVDNVVPPLTSESILPFVIREVSTPEPWHAQGTVPVC